MRVAVYEPVLCFCGLWGRETSSGKFPVHKAEAEELNGAYKPIEASRESMKSSAHLNSPGQLWFIFELSTQPKSIFKSTQLNYAELSQSCLAEFLS
jgi:hypothetical protein